MTEHAHVLVKQQTCGICKAEVIADIGIEERMGKLSFFTVRRHWFEFRSPRVEVKS